MGLLTGGVRALAGQLLGGVYPAGTVTRMVEAHDGQGGLTRTPSVADCRVQVDRVTEEMRKADGFTELDAGLYVLASSYPQRLQPGDKIEVLEGPHEGTIWRVAPPITADPGGAYQLCRGTLPEAAE